MSDPDMSPRAVTTRLKRVAQLRRTFLLLSKGTLSPRKESSREPPMREVTELDSAK